MLLYEFSEVWLPGFWTLSETLTSLSYLVNYAQTYGNTEIGGIKKYKRTESNHSMYDLRKLVLSTPKFKNHEPQNHKQTQSCGKKKNQTV